MSITWGPLSLTSANMNDIGTSRFLERFICSENLLCNGFKRQALCHKSEINLG